MKKSSAEIAFGTGKVWLIQSAHNWRVIDSDAIATREQCERHCKATGRRSKQTGHLLAFDLYGQMPRKERAEFLLELSEQDKCAE